MEVGPQGGAADRLDRMEQVMVVDPVDAQVDEAQDVGQQLGSQRRQGIERGPVRWSQLEDHDRDDDGEDAIAERLEPALAHEPGPNRLVP